MLILLLVLVLQDALRTIFEVLVLVLVLESQALVLVRCPCGLVLVLNYPCRGPLVLAKFVIRCFSMIYNMK